MDLFIILTAVMVLQVYTLVKTYQTTCPKYVKFMIFQLNLSRHIKIEKIFKCANLITFKDIHFY